MTHEILDALAIVALCVCSVLFALRKRPQ